MSDVDEKVRVDREEEARLLQIGRERDRIAKANADFFLDMFRESVKNDPPKWDPEQDYDLLWDQMNAEEKQATEANWLRTRRKLANVFHRQRYEELYAYRVKRQAERQKLGYIHDGRGKFDPGRPPLRENREWRLKTWNDFRERELTVTRRSIGWLFERSLYPWPQEITLETTVSITKLSPVQGAWWARLPDQLAFPKLKKYRTPELSWTAYLCLRERMLTPLNSPLRSTAKPPRRSRKRQRELEAHQFLELQTWLCADIATKDEFRELAKSTLRKAIKAQRRIEPARRSQTATYSDDVPEHNPCGEAPPRRPLQAADEQSIRAVPRGLSRLNAIRARVLNCRPIPPRFYTRTWKVAEGALEIWSTSPNCKLVKMARPRPARKVPTRTPRKLKLVPGRPKSSRMNGRIR